MAQRQQAKHQYFGTKAAKQAPVPWHKSDKASTSTLAQKRQTKNQYLAQFAFIQILLPVANYHSFYCHPMKTWGLNMFPVDSKDSRSSFHLADTGLSHLSFTSLYSLYTCERHSIRNVSNLLICWYAHVLNVLTLHVVTEVQSCIRPNSTHWLRIKTVKP